MFLMGRNNHFVLSGMPIGWDMVAGMAAIVGGCAIAAYGLLPRDIARQLAASQDIVVTPPEDAPLGRAHWGLMSVLVIALIIDIMKPATLGFTLPGMMAEYHVTKATVSSFPFSALVGTVIGSVIWGGLADIYGRKATILLSAVMFVGTSICGAMPSLGWNVGMCFMMGVAAGGMLPVTYALLAEMMPSKHRGWSLVLVGGLGAVGGYFAASGFSALAAAVLRLADPLGAQPADRPVAGLARRLHPRIGQVPACARPPGGGAAGDGSLRLEGPADAPRRAGRARAGPSVALTGRAFFGKLFALSLAAICFSLINFGLLLWLPADLVAKGYSVGVASKLLAESALIAFPTVFLVAYLYSRWSTKWSVVASLAVTLRDWRACCGWSYRCGSPVLPVALLIIGTNALIAMLLPYTAESFPLRIRGRTTGTVAACTKAGGMVAQLLAMFALVPPLAVVSLASWCRRLSRSCWSPGSARRRAGATCASSIPTATLSPATGM